MASDTITTGLKKYAIGNKLRRLRLRKSMGLLELSKHTGLSPALLSKLERDVMHPTLPTLLRIAMVFSVGLEYFFNPEPRPVAGDRPQEGAPALSGVAGCRPSRLLLREPGLPVPDRVLNSYFAEFEPIEAEHHRLHEHPGIEFLYVLSGRLELRTGENKHELAEGDASTLIPPCRTATAESGQSAPQRWWWHWSRGSRLRPRRRTYWTVALLT